jgi:hypothetical protein
MINATTLAAPVDRNALDISVASVTGASAGRIVKIENEYAVVVKVVGSIVSLRSRGDNGTTAKDHNILAPVVFGDATDFQSIPEARHRGQAEEIDNVIYYGASGAIAIPDKNSTIILAGASPLAMTLADPSRLQDGLELDIQSAGAAAHTVTAPLGFNSGGAAVDVATAGAAVANNLKIRAVSGKWLIVSNVGFTLA